MADDLRPPSNNNDLDYEEEEHEQLEGVIQHSRGGWEEEEEDGEIDDLEDGEVKDDFDSADGMDDEDDDCDEGPPPMFTGEPFLSKPLSPPPPLLGARPLPPLVTTVLRPGRPLRPPPVVMRPPIRLGGGGGRPLFPQPSRPATTTPTDEVCSPQTLTPSSGPLINTPILPAPLPPTVGVGLPATATNEPPTKKIPCKYFARGMCMYGEACKFLHAKLQQENPAVGAYLQPGVLPRMPPTPLYQPQIHPVPMMPPLPLPIPTLKQNPDDSNWERGLKQARQMMKKAKKKEHGVSDHSSTSEDEREAKELDPRVNAQRDDAKLRGEEAYSRPGQRASENYQRQYRKKQTFPPSPPSDDDDGSPSDRFGRKMGGHGPSTPNTEERMDEYEREYFQRWQANMPGPRDYHQYEMRNRQPMDVQMQSDQQRSKTHHQQRPPGPRGRSTYYGDSGHHHRDRDRDRDRHNRNHKRHSRHRDRSLSHSRSHSRSHRNHKRERDRHSHRRDHVPDRPLPYERPEQEWKDPWDRRHHEDISSKRHHSPALSFSSSSKSSKKSSRGASPSSPVPEDTKNECGNSSEKQINIPDRYNQKEENVQHHDEEPDENFESGGTITMAYDGSEIEKQVSPKGTMGANKKKTEGIILKIPKELSNKKDDPGMGSQPPKHKKRRTSDEKTVAPEKKSASTKAHRSPEKKSSKNGHKANELRREELLKQLASIEEAIAKKRST